MKQAIILIGGYNSFWPTYLRMARDLEDLSGLQAVGVPLVPWDWWSARRAGEATLLLHKVAQTVAWARRRFRADRFILVGHSAGGLIARLYLSDRPVWGRVYAGVEHVTAVVTLGSPHCSDRGADTGWFLSSMTNQLVPGTPYAEAVRYYAVAGRYLLGRQDGDYRQRRAFGSYRFFTGRGDLWGDGVVPVQSAVLEGAEAVVLEGVAHSRKYGFPWYGSSKAVIRRWWRQGGG